MIEVSIADDHPIMREGIKKVLLTEIDIALVGEASDGCEVRTMLEKRLPDLLIMDLTMPGNSGLNLIKDLAYRYESLPILVLSIHPARRFAVRTLRAGASGYLCKTSISEELVSAVRKIAVQKRKYITPELAELLADEVNHEDPAGELHETLSDREFEILCMIASGNRIKEIAAKLSLSPATVHTYRTRIKDKMNLETNVEMTRYAIENELVN